MSNPPEDTQNPTQEQPEAEGGPGTQPDPPEPEGGNAEAARYRTRLRATEGERDTLSQRVERMQRREVERLAGERLAQPGDLFAVGGTALADLLTDDGDVDAERVTEAVQALLDARPGLHRDAKATWPDMGAGQRETGSPGKTWGSVLRGR